MSNSVSGNFSIPDGFSEERIEGQLYYEDLDEDDELWLIRMPSNIELSALDRKKICLPENSGDTKVKDIKTEDGKVLECYTEKCEIPNVCVVLPQRSDETLNAVKKVIKGTILISEGLVLNDDIKVKSENEQEDNTVEPKKKKRHLNDYNTEGAVLKDDIVVKSENDQDDNTVEPKKKKDKKKKRHLNDSDKRNLNYDTEGAVLKDDIEVNSENEQDNIVESKKKKDKKKKRHSIDIHKTNVNYDTEDAVLDYDIKVKTEKEEDYSVSKKKKDKKKKKHTNDIDKSDLNYDIEDAETVTSNIHNKRAKKHSRSHKKSNSESVEIKNEPHSMDYDVFPHCVSQK